MNKILTYILLFLALPFGLKAQQNATIYGRVSDSISGEPMEMVNIYTSDADRQKGVVTDKEG
ncbi:MAG: carboxypeptidase-like regulatory domain-containing protein, partial [Bacteroidales bacterium]|nr:carboxypeptidase-like regulatory domain-containing protein [Bacteroidales bacterium]